MRHRKKRSLDEPDQNWLVSYSDMMTLLLFIFVILYCLAVQNQGRVNEALQSFYGAFAGGNRASVFDSSNLGSIPVKGQAGSEDSIYSDVNKYIEKNNLKGKVNVQEKDNGISLELQENILFDPGSALIKPENTGVLDKIGELLKTLSNDIIIEGYTDDRPIDSGYYQSNWELSSDRAVKILRYFTDTAGLKPERFQAVGYGQYKPIADNRTAEGRRKNRRVDIIIIENNASSGH